MGHFYRLSINGRYLAKKEGLRDSLNINRNAQLCTFNDLANYFLAGLKDEHFRIR
jgi:hypothetical protein